MNEREYWAAYLMAGVLVFLIACWVDWYCSGVQQKVYERQGTHLTQWEVFTGSTPVERYIINGSTNR